MLARPVNNEPRTNMVAGSESGRASSCCTMVASMMNVSMARAVKSTFFMTVFAFPGVVALLLENQFVCRMQDML